VNHFSLAEEADDIVDIGIIGQTEDIVIGDAGFLLRGKILRQVGDHIAFHLNAGGTPWEAGSGSGINPGGVIDEIGGKIRHTDVLVGEVAGQLIDHGTHHFQMAQLLGTCRGVSKEEHVRLFFMLLSRQ